MSKHRHKWIEWGKIDNDYPDFTTVYSLCMCGACKKQVIDEHVSDTRVREPDGTYRDMPSRYSGY